MQGHTYRARWFERMVCILTVQGFERKPSHQTIRRAITN